VNSEKTACKLVYLHYISGQNFNIKIANRTFKELDTLKTFQNGNKIKVDLTVGSAERLGMG
jgi:hypothetical protein